MIIAVIQEYRFHLSTIMATAYNYGPVYPPLLPGYFLLELI